MKWFALAFDIAVFIYNHVSGKGKRDLDKELDLAKATINVLSKDKTLAEKSQAFEDAVSSLLSLPGVSGWVQQGFVKAKTRLYKKLF